jgi:hypothetical protein
MNNYPGKSFCSACRFLPSIVRALLFATSLAFASHAFSEDANGSINAKVDSEQAKFAIQAEFRSGGESREKAIYGALILQSVHVSTEKLTHTFRVKVDAVQGALREIVFALSGEGEVKTVTASGLEDWSVRQTGKSGRSLVARLQKAEKPITATTIDIVAETVLKDRGAIVDSLSLTLEQPALANGYVRLNADPGLTVRVPNPAGLVPIELKYLPPNFQVETNESPARLAFRFLGTTYSLPISLEPTDPEADKVVLRDFRLVGKMSDVDAAFTLTGIAHVTNPKGSSLLLLSGGVALTEINPRPDWRLRFDRGSYIATFDKAGDYSIDLKFKAAIQFTNGWKQIDFTTAPSSLQPVILHGLKADAQFESGEGAKPEPAGADFNTFLPSNGHLKLAWKEKASEKEGALFFAAEELSQITVSPGLMRQTALIDFKVMQGELSKVRLLIQGVGEVTRVQGSQVLSWSVQSVTNSPDRQIEVRLNQPQKDKFTLEVQLQSPLDAFPQTVSVAQIRPQGATRFGGNFRIANEGAVRLEVIQANGLSQISPDQFPQTEQAKALLPDQTTQVFAYRFSGIAFDLRIQADNIRPELGVSEVLVYHLGETELTIDADIELDVREAPLRELLLTVPKGFAAARLNASGMNDYFLTAPPDQPVAQLRIVYGSPVSGRQLVQLRLERNSALNSNSWTLPRVEVVKAKSVRGHVGVSAAPGYRITPATTQGLTEIDSAFFPRKTAGMQAAFRLSDPAWQASMNVERLPQSIQADVFHLFSVGEGIAYGSSLMNYVISGAPVSALKIALTNEYFNVEFTGKDVRNWQKIDGGFLVQLHTPVSGSYTLLATYERPFKAQGEMLRFIGGQPLDAQSEQGHTIVVSTYQFQVRPVNVSTGLQALEPGEVPPEYRLFFDAPILAAYRYTARPFNLQLELKPLAQGETVNQVVDRASLTTRISRDGQVLTDARYFVKNRTSPNFRLILPEGAQLWSVTVDGNPVVPVTADRANLIPLPQKADPNSIQDIQVKIASKSGDTRNLTIAAPIVTAPVLLANWKIEPETGQKLLYRGGSLAPIKAANNNSGFAILVRLWNSLSPRSTYGACGIMLALLVVGVVTFRFASGADSYKFSPRHLLGGLLGAVACAAAIALLFQFVELALSFKTEIPPGLEFIVPIQQPESSLILQVAHVPLAPSALEWSWRLWPLLGALALWFSGLVILEGFNRKLAILTGWLLLFWAPLRAPNGAAWFFVVVIAFVIVQIAVPLLVQWWQVPRKTPPDTAPGGLAATTVLLLLGAFSSIAPAASAQEMNTVAIDPAKRVARADSVSHQVHVTNDVVFGTASFHWNARKGQLLSLLHGAAVITKLEFSRDSARLVQTGTDGQSRPAIMAEKDAVIEIELHYQVAVVVRNGERGFTLPTQHGLVGTLKLALTDLSAEVIAPQAVSIVRDVSGSNALAVFNLVLSPVNDAWIAWKPGTRDPNKEKPVFYADLAQLYVPGAGIIEGLHQIQFRPAQGVLHEVIIDVPAGLTITDVLGGPVSLWRFDPTTRKLRVGLSPGQAQPFTLLIKSQTATGPLPSEQSIGLLSVNNAAGQVGLLGIATGSEVQLDDAGGSGFSIINLEDFPAAVLEPLRAQVPGLNLRRAFRYASPTSVIALKASAVQPDVRVESQQTLSLGEDRTVLAVNLTVAITRAGIFKLSFLLPTGLDVDSITGAAMSHWTEVKTDAGRIITLDLKSRTEGTQQFALTLTGPGIRTATNWAVPNLLLGEATKQSGQLLIVPEQGMRVQVSTREGMTQLDPLQYGVHQKGVLAFRLLQSDWKLALDLERVDAWTQVTSLQQIICEESMLRITGNLQYEIENAGLKTLRVRLPANAENVHFRGDQVSDSVDRIVQTNTALRDWEIKLARRVSGKLLLHVDYNQRLAQGVTNTVVIGIQAQDVNLQRGFVALQSNSRLQARIDVVPPALQPVEPQSIPRTLWADSTSLPANYTFRLVEPDFQLPLRFDRHEAAKLLPAHVTNVELTSVISDNGVMLTQVRLTLIPGDKQLLHLTLPGDARFWFAFVNQNSVWPWSDQQQILIPLEQHSKTGEQVTVEFLYTSQAATAKARRMDLALVGPRFDLPLENIKWHVFLNERWHPGKWTGTLELRDQNNAPQPVSVDLETYARQEAGAQKEKTREAGQFLSLANSLLEKGDPEQARRAFQNAYGLSQHDNAFNEDARVQLHNLKTQQALVGLNVRQAKIAGQGDILAAAPRNLRDNLAPAYTQQEAKHLMDLNSAEENAVQMRLVERVIQQQEAVVAKPSAITATIPQQGRELTFERSLQVETNTDLRINLRVRETTGVTVVSKGLILGGILAFIRLFGAIAWSKPSNSRTSTTID